MHTLNVSLFDLRGSMSLAQRGMRKRREEEEGFFRRRNPPGHLLSESFYIFTQKRDIRRSQ